MTNENEAPELKAALETHGLKTDKPSQLSDAFRLGWNTRADLSDAKDKRIAKLEKELAKAVKLMELSVELATWNTTLIDDVIFFIIELKGTDQ